MFLGKNNLISYGALRAYIYTFFGHMTFPLAMPMVMPMAIPMVIPMAIPMAIPMVIPMVIPMAIAERYRPLHYKQSLETPEMRYPHHFLPIQLHLQVHTRNSTNF